jgi:hypothetical protein
MYTPYPTSVIPYPTSVIPACAGMTKEIWIQDLSRPQFGEEGVDGVAECIGLGADAAG